MSYLSSDKHRTILFVVKIIFISCVAISLLLFGIALFVAVTQPSIKSVSFDNSSDWSSYFRSETGFPTLNIHILCSREHICCINTIGSERPAAWFENLGFEILGEEEKANVSAAIKIFPEDDFPQRVVYMLHPRLPHVSFSYLSKTGVLMHYESVKY